MSFDGAKLRRILEQNKSFCGIVCANIIFSVEKGAFSD